MITLSEYSIKLLKDAAINPSEAFDFIQVASGGWQTPYGYICEPEKCEIIEESLDYLLLNGYIIELAPNGGRFIISDKGIKILNSIK